MTKIWALSDLHLDINTDLKLGTHPEADIIIIAGDLSDGDFDPSPWLMREFTEAERAKAVLVPGNHEAWSIGLAGVAGKMQRLAERTGITPLTEATTHIAGHRVVGTTLWTELEPHVSGAAGLGLGCLSRVPGLTPDLWRLEHQRCRRFLEETVRKGDIVVTHHAPSQEGLNVEMQHNMYLMSMSSAYFSPLEDLAQGLQPALWVHGHTHTSREYQIGGTPVVVNCRGYDSELLWRPQLVVEIDTPHQL